MLFSAFVMYGNQKIRKVLSLKETYFKQMSFEVFAKFKIVFLFTDIFIVI